MKFFSFLFFTGLIIINCNTSDTSIDISDQEKILLTIIKFEEDTTWGKIRSAKYGKYYLLADHFQDSLYLDHSVSFLNQKEGLIQKIKLQYKNEVNKNKKLNTDKFNLIHLKEFTNTSPEMLIFTLPIKYQEYYIVNFSFYSWSSGYSSILVLKEDASGNFKVIQRNVYSVI